MVYNSFVDGVCLLGINEVWRVVLYMFPRQDHSGDGDPKNDYD